MKRKRQGSIEWLEFDLLTDRREIAHAVFLKHGGASGGPYASLNAGGGTQDQPDSITENLERMRNVLGLSQLVSVYQRHGVELVKVPSESPREGDILVTQEKEIGLTIRHADCQAAIIYDPIHHAVANVHCGWRGNVQNIYQRTIHWMERELGSQPKDLLICISPSLGPEAAEFIHYTSEFPPSFLPFKMKDRPYFNLWEISRSQLLDAGIMADHIEIAGLCTFAENKDFFSYRREKDTGRHATIVALK